MKSKKGIFIITVVLLIALCVALAGGFIYLRNDNPLQNILEEPSLSTSDNFIKQNFTDMIILDMDSAIDTAFDYFNLAGTNMNFRPRSENSVRGDNFFRISQYYKDIPVWGRGLVVLVHEDGANPELSGNYITFSDISVSPTLSENDAFEVAEELFGENLHIRSLGLTIYSLGVVPLLCYKIDVVGIADDGFSARTLFMCANTGEVVSVRGQIFEIEEHSTIRAIGQDGHIEGGAFHDLPFYKIDDEAIMFCNRRNIAVYSFSFDNARHDLMLLVDMLPNGFNPNKVIRLYEDNQRNNRAGVDAFGNTIVVYDFFANNLGWRQFNNNPDTHLPIVVDILTSDSGRNAFFWMSPNELHGVIGFEMPGPTMFDTQLSANLDVVAHEFVHGVCRSTWVPPRNFSDNEREAAAIFEAIADIFGEIIEHYHTGHNDWKMAGFGYDYIRNIYDGQGLAFNMQEGPHNNSRIISWIAREIEHSFPFTDREQLISYAQLWHGVQNSLSYTPTFQCFANHTVRYAHRMLNDGQITDTQFQAVRNAFEQNGIEASIELEDIGIGAVIGVDVAIIREAYMEFLRQREFQPYVDDWSLWVAPITEYAILDIDGDEIPELIIRTPPDNIYMDFVFSYDIEQEEVIFISVIIRESALYYSQQLRALVKTGFAGVGESYTQFMTLYSLKMGGCSYESGVTKGISSEELQIYIDELIEIEFSPILTPNIEPRPSQEAVNISDDWQGWFSIPYGEWFGDNPPEAGGFSGGSLYQHPTDSESWIVFAGDGFWNDRQPTDYPVVILIPVSRFLGQPSTSVEELSRLFGEDFVVEYNDTYFDSWIAGLETDEYGMLFILESEYDTNITRVEIHRRLNS